MFAILRWRLRLVQSDQEPTGKMRQSSTSSRLAEKRARRPKSGQPRLRQSGRTNAHPRVQVEAERRPVRKYVALARLIRVQP